MQNLCNDKMKLNKFVDVKLPNNKVLFQRCQNMTLPHGSHDVPTADFTSRNIESIADADRMVTSEYNDYLRASQMPIDTPTPFVDKSSDNDS